MSKIRKLIRNIKANMKKIDRACKRSKTNKTYAGIKKDRGNKVSKNSITKHKGAGIRRSYMTLCFMNNTEVTHINRNGFIEVSYEQPCNNGFKTLINDINGNVISNTGFNAEEVQFFCKFTRDNADLIAAESVGRL